MNVLCGLLFSARGGPALSGFFFCRCCSSFRSLFCLRGQDDSLWRRRHFNFLFFEFRYGCDGFVSLRYQDGARREHKVSCSNVATDINEFRKINHEEAWQFCRSDLYLYLVHCFHDDVTCLFGWRDTLPFERYFNRNLLSLFEHIKIDMDEFARYRMELRGVDERIFVLADALQGDDTGLTRRFPHAVQLASVDRDGSGLFPRTIENGRHNAMLPQ